MTSSRFTDKEVVALLDAEEEEDAVDEPFYPGSDEEIAVLEEEEEDENADNVEEEHENVDTGDETENESEDDTEIRCVFTVLSHKTTIIHRLKHIIGYILTLQLRQHQVVLSPPPAQSDTSIYRQGWSTLHYPKHCKGGLLPVLYFHYY